MAGEDEEEPFRQLQPQFFDLIIVDECHRGSAREDSRWRKVLEYFSSATQIGLTATPKADETANTFDYFGEPIYTYSLKQGIEDGFLAPYKVIRSLINVDDHWRPSRGLLDDEGNEIEDREYNERDYDKNIVLQDRTLRVAKRITQWLKDNGRMSKAIVFCVGQNHAERMRTLLGNLNADMKQKDSRYIMRITGDDAEGKKQLEYFINEHEPYPVVATTSQLLSTGVDCKTVKLIVLDKTLDQ
ncbi:DEAD/DEAH box helicase family protein [Spirabiliibacterium mucosae]|uniref:DEAD/DEAH box helicase family protein n=1 Tax=Spirabiliibacterium mucosae TaxID=28156 RepID=UPI00249E2376|nr:DEAD/DEAH box helicase family protein [Spirabiliibacterium mucosae]